MKDKIDRALKLFAFAMPGPVREILQELGAEIDRLRADIEELRSRGK